MSNEIKPYGDFSLVWEKPDQIKKLFAPSLTNDEFAFFMGLSKLAEADPFKHEIWAVKYDKTKPAAVFLGRNFFRKVAHSQADYDFHSSDAVYENDTFEVENGIPRHIYNLKDRGELLGAYAVAKRKNSSQPNFVFVNVKDYDKNQSLWKTLKSVMICKVAESQVLRMTWSVLSGAYDEAEQGVFQRQKIKAMPRKKQELMPGTEGLPITEISNPEPEWVFTSDLQTKMVSRAAAAQMSLDGLKKYLEANNLPEFSQLSKDEFDRIMDDLEARVKK